VIRRCGDHGYFEGEGCPRCGVSDDPVLTEDRRVRLSKYLSGALRHFPDDAGIDLDDGGWTPFADLVVAASEQYDWADREAVTAVVATDPRGRFEYEVDGSGNGDDADTPADGPVEGGRIRATYGHSVEVDLESTDDPVPDRLYHGTAPANLESIRRTGLRPIGRQEVHLSASVDRAREVGRRHADEPAVLVIDADRLRAAGHEVARRGEGVYATDRVPPEHLAVLHGGDRDGTLLDGAVDTEES
jgi:putative RNA 2'-phosphotransferase